MWYKTDLMEQILTSESAKQMIDYVSRRFMGNQESDFGCSK